MQEHPYFVRDKVVVLAHRGFTPPAENTEGAIQHAVAAGADIIETDVHSSKDGVAVLCHDSDLVRIAGVSSKVSELSWDELRKLKLKDGSTLLSLQDALRIFPQTKFNIDIKDTAAIDGTVQAIELNHAHNRVLVSSFSNKTRKAALKSFTKPVATSASASVVISTWFLFKLGVKDFSMYLLGIGALQIPTSLFGIKLDNPKFIHRVSSSGTQIHFWTINEASEMQRLVKLGANGIVTDNTSLAIEALGTTS